MTFEPAELSDWEVAEGFRPNWPIVCDEILRSEKPNLLAMQMATQAADSLQRQSKERTVAAYLEECGDRRGFWRHTLVIAIESRTLFNQFFNGRCGYRAMYWRSPSMGKCYNDITIRYIVEQLRTAATANPFWASVLANASLTYPSAKLWAFFENQMIRDALIVAKWSNSPMGLSIFDSRYPVFILKGAFVNLEGKEHDPKPDRSQRLHDEGYV